MTVIRHDRVGYRGFLRNHGYQMDFQTANFLETRWKPVRKARVTEVDYCSFLGNHGYQRVSHPLF